MTSYNYEYVPISCFNTKTDNTNVKKSLRFQIDLYIGIHTRSSQILYDSSHGGAQACSEGHLYRRVFSTRRIHSPHLPGWYIPRPWIVGRPACVQTWKIHWWERNAEKFRSYVPVWIRWVPITHFELFSSVLIQTCCLYIKHVYSAGNYLRILMSSLICSD